jgi:hypothetical protein
MDLDLPLGTSFRTLRRTCLDSRFGPEGLLSSTAGGYLACQLGW